MPQFPHVDGGTETKGTDVCRAHAPRLGTAAAEPLCLTLPVLCWKSPWRRSSPVVLDSAKFWGEV